MPSHKSCVKRMKISERQRMRNRALRSELRNAVKAVRTEQSKEQAQKNLREAIRILDQAAGAGLIHKCNANRNKSRLTLHVNKLG